MKYPEYVENFLPLSNFEEMVEEARKEHFKDTDPFDDPEEANQSDVDFFNENFIDIFIYFYEEFEESMYLEEIAFGCGYSLAGVKFRLNRTYKDRFRFKEWQLNEKLLEETSYELSTKFWPEGETAAEWWRKKAQEKNADKNFLIFSENMVKFHLKEIRGSYILDCLKDLPLEEKARIIKEAKETCEWFIK